MTQVSLSLCGCRAPVPGLAAKVARVASTSSPRPHTHSHPAAPCWPPAVETLRVRAREKRKKKKKRDRQRGCGDGGGLRLVACLLVYGVSLDSSRLTAAALLLLFIPLFPSTPRDSHPSSLAPVPRLAPPPHYPTPLLLLARAATQVLGLPSVTSHVTCQPTWTAWRAWNLQSGSWQRQLLAGRCQRWLSPLAGQDLPDSEGRTALLE